MKILVFAAWFFLALALILGSTSIALGQGNPSFRVTGGVPSGLQLPDPNLANLYLEALYRWLLGLVGLAALFAFVYGGILYIFSGAIASTAEAKRWITNGVLGLVIAGISYLILYTINPNLVRTFNIQTIINSRL